MSTMREQFETWQSKQGRALRLAKEDSGKYCSSDVQSDWDVWQAATEAAKAESQDDNKPAMYCVPDKDGKPLFGKGWMFSPIPQLAATMPLYTRPAAKATGTAGEQTKQSFENIEELPPLPPYVKYALHCLAGEEAKAEAERQMREYGQQCAKTAMAKVYAIAVEEKAKMDAEAARQPAPVMSDKQIDELWAEVLATNPLPQPAYRALVRAALAAATNRSQP